MVVGLQCCQIIFSPIHHTARWRDISDVSDVIVVSTSGLTVMVTILRSYLKEGVGGGLLTMASWRV